MEMKIRINKTYTIPLLIIIIYYIYFNFLKTRNNSKLEEKSEKYIFEGNEGSLRNHKIPKWWRDSKLGIFIHYGVYSVPGYAPVDETEPENLRDASEADAQFIKMKGMPYAEWYYNTMRLNGSKTSIFHKDNYGTKSYFDFKSNFEKDSKSWSPKYWKNIFDQVNAGYVVLTTKHHEGFTLWKSDYPSIDEKNVFVGRDIVAELEKEIRNSKIKLGLYYSGGLDWQWNDIVDETKWRPLGPAQPEYSTYALNQLNELVTKFKPFILWNDLGWPKLTKNDLFDVFANFYNQNSDGLVNDRWSLPKSNKNGALWRGDFLTPEYTMIDTGKDQTLCCLIYLK